jgi:hypothetical protein
LSRLTPNAEEINNQCGFRRNRLTTDNILCIRQLHEKKWEYNEAVLQLFIHIKEAFDSIGKEVAYNILIEFGIPMKPVRLIKMCRNETYSRDQVGKHLSSMFPIMNDLKQGEALSP